MANPNAILQEGFINNIIGCFKTKLPTSSSTTRLRRHDALDPSDFSAAWREGQAMTLEQAVAEELDSSR